MCTVLDGIEPLLILFDVPVPAAIAITNHLFKYRETNGISMCHLHTLLYRYIYFHNTSDIYFASFCLFLQIVSKHWQLFLYRSPPDLWKSMKTAIISTNHNLQCTLFPRSKNIDEYHHPFIPHHHQLLRQKSPQNTFFYVVQVFFSYFHLEPSSPQYSGAFPSRTHRSKRYPFDTFSNAPS